jgi:hypothetical protein
MKHLKRALMLFFRYLTDKKFAKAIEQGTGLKDLLKENLPSRARSDAITLLSILQSEARFLDFMMENIDAYTDDQIGAAAREVHRKTQSVLKACFEIEPLRKEAEGSTLTLPSSYDSAEYKVAGEAGKSHSFKCIIHHPGWQARKCELPVWKGTDRFSMIIAPAEVEVEK